VPSYASSALEGAGRVGTAQHAMLSIFSNMTPGLWIDVAAAAGGLILILGIVVISRRGPKKKIEPPPRTEEQARAAQANRDRLAGRR
jgi:hypothetical protein